MSATPPHVQARQRTVHVIQGDHAVSSDPGVVLTTILGSCVAACMCDPLAGVGGINHFLLPGNADAGGESMKYGVNAMELLINGLLRKGALRHRIEVKLFGGAHVVHNLSDIGEKNATFAREFLRAEGLLCVGESLGGANARRIRYWPASGRASQMLLDSSHAEVFKTERVREAPPVAPDAGELELF